MGNSKSLSKKLTFLTVAIGIIGLLSFMMIGTAFAVTCPEGTLRYGDDDGVAYFSECNIPAETIDIMEVVNTIINVIVGFIGVIAVVVIILGGLTYSTSLGDPARVKKAKDTILYGIIGLIVSLLAYAIVNFVLSNVFSEDATESDASSVEADASVEADNDSEGESAPEPSGKNDTPVLPRPTLNRYGKAPTGNEGWNQE